VSIFQLSIWSAASLLFVLLILNRKPITPNYRRILNSTHNICFASSEWQCFSTPSGGLGRAFFSQSVDLIKQGMKVVALNIHESLSSDSCESAESYLVSKIMIDVQSNIDWFKAPLPTKRAFSLFQWLLQNPHVCSILHVPDWKGLGVFVALARNASLPVFRNLRINIQLHGTEFQISSETDGSKNLAAVFTSAQERMTIELADHLTFLSHSNYQDMTRLWNIERSKFTIIPNTFSVSEFQFQHLAQRFEYGQQLIQIRTIIFYGKINFRKGFFLFCQSFKHIDVNLLAHVHIVIVGPLNIPRRNFLKELFILRKNSRTKVTYFTDLNSEQAINMITSMSKNAVVVIPSYLEFQSYALIDILQTAAPFLLSNISAHRSEIPVDIHPICLFELEPRELGNKLKFVLKNGIFWKPVKIRNVDSKLLWREWHARTMKSISHQPFEEPFPSRPDHESVSVVVTVCNRLQHLQMALNSIIRQSHPSDLIHLILVMACPNDIVCSNTGIENLEFSTLESNFQCVEAIEIPSSLGYARNVGVNAAKTKRVIFLDDDDLLDRDIVKNYLRAAIANPQIAIWTSWADIFLSETSHSDNFPTDFVSRWGQIGAAAELCTLINVVGGAHMMIDKSSQFWKSTGGFSTLTGTGCEDWEILAAAALENTVQLIPLRGLWYRKSVVNGKTQGMLSDALSSPEARDRCMLRALKGSLSRTNRIKFVPPLHYLASMYTGYEADKW
jgi:glycosyltransferase involved in cell wall biosynthesis